eukprot:GEMP01000127.1.p1 GENE.GEMP01000127.1~~GEMP01000127.1.p1  ORF type:complete len:3050 (-),score=463.41 GEMP01000127.1:252-9401(-)
MHVDLETRVRVKLANQSLRFTEHIGCFADSDGADDSKLEYHKQWSIDSIDDCLDACNYYEESVVDLWETTIMRGSEEYDHDLDQLRCEAFEYWIGDTGVPRCELYATQNLPHLDAANCRSRKKARRVFQRENESGLRKKSVTAKGIQMSVRGMLKSMMDSMQEDIGDALITLVRFNLEDIHNMERGPGYAVPSHNISHPVPCSPINIDRTNSRASNISDTCSRDHFQHIVNFFAEEASTTLTTTTTMMACLLLDRPVPPSPTSKLHNLNTNPLDKDLKQLSRALMDWTSGLYLPKFLASWTASGDNDQDRIVFTTQDMSRIRAWSPWKEAAARPPPYAQEDINLPETIMRWPFLGAQWDVTFAVTEVNMTLHNLKRSTIKLWDGSDPHARDHKVHIMEPVEIGAELRVKAMSQGRLLDGLLPKMSIPEHTIRLHLEFRGIDLHWRTFVYANETRMRAALTNYDVRCVAQAISQLHTTFVSDIRWNLTAIKASVTDSDYFESNFISSVLETEISHAIVEKVFRQTMRKYFLQWIEAALQEAWNTIGQVQQDADAHEPCTPREGAPDAEGTPNEEQATEKRRDNDKVVDAEEDAPYDIIPIICASWPNNCTDGELAFVAFDDLPWQITVLAAMVHSNTLPTIDDSGVSFSNIDIGIHLSLFHLSVFANLRLDSVRTPILPGITSASSLVPPLHDRLFACEGQTSLDEGERELTWLPCSGLLHAMRLLYDRVFRVSGKMNNTREENPNNAVSPLSSGNASVPTGLISVVENVLLLGGGRPLINSLLSKVLDPSRGWQVEVIEFEVGSVELTNDTVWHVLIRRARLKVRASTQCLYCGGINLVIDMVVEHASLVASVQLLTEFLSETADLHPTVKCFMSHLWASVRLDSLHLRDVGSALMNVSISDVHSWLNWPVPMGLANKCLEHVAEVLKRSGSTAIQDTDCAFPNISRAPGSLKWNPDLPPLSLPRAYQKALDTILVVANTTLSKDTLQLMAMTGTEMVNTGLLSALKDPDNIKINEYVFDFNVTKLRINGIDDTVRTQRDLFDAVEVRLLNDSRLEIFINTNDLSVSHELSVELSLSFNEKNRPKSRASELDLRAVITAAQLHVILSPNPARDTDRWDQYRELLDHSPWCALDNALVDLFAFEISVGALCVSAKTRCMGHDVLLTTDETKYLKAMLATFIQDALQKRRLNLDTLCSNEHHNHKHKFSFHENDNDKANAGNVNEHLVPLLSLTRLANEAKYILAPLVTEFLREPQSWLPRGFPLVASMFSAHSLFKNVTSLRNWRVTVRNLTNVTFHDDGVISNTLPNVDDEDGGDNNDNNHDILLADVTIDTIEVEVAVDVMFPSHRNGRLWKVKTRAHIQGIQSTVAGRLFVSQSALKFTDSDSFIPDWRCLLDKFRPSFALTRIDIHNITSCTFHTTINTHETLSIVHPANVVSVARFFARRLKGHRVVSNNLFNNIRCTMPLVDRNASSQRYHLSPVKASLLRDFAPTAQLAVRAISALVFNREFFQSFLSESVQWFKGEGGQNRIDGTDGMFDNGAGLVDLQIVGGRIEVVTSTPKDHPITITFENTVSALRTHIDNILPYLLDRLVPSISRSIGTRTLQAHAIVDQIQFQLLFHVNREPSYFLGKSGAWWASGCALLHIEIDLAVLHLHLRRLCFQLSCTEDIEGREAALLRSAIATLMDATLKKAFYLYVKQNCIENFDKYPFITEDEKDGPLPPQYALPEFGWDGLVRWGKNDLMRAASESIKRSVPYVREAREDMEEEDVRGMMSVNGMMELLHHQGRIILLPTKTSIGAGSNDVRVEVGSLVLYAPQMETLSVSGYTIINVTRNAERDALVARINDTSWELHPSGTDDILGLPMDVTLLQIRERSTNTWHHRYANDFVVNNKSVRQLLSGIAIDGTTTLTFAHAANASIRYTHRDATLFTARLDHVSVKGSVSELTGPLVAMAEDVILQEDESRTVVRAYAASVLPREWRYIWSTEIAESGTVDVLFDMDAYVVSHAPMFSMNGIYARSDVSGDDASYSNGHFILRSWKNRGIWELRKDDIVVYSRTANAEGKWDDLRLGFRKVANSTEFLSVTVTLMHNDEVFPQRISPNISVYGMHFAVHAYDNCYRVHFTNWTNKDSGQPKLDSTSKRQTSCAGAARLKIEIISDNTLLVIRRSTPTIRFDVLNAEDVALGVKIGLSNTTFSFQGATSLRPKSSRALDPFHIEIQMHDFNADARVFVKADSRFFDIPKLFLNGLTACHIDYLMRVEVHKLYLSSHIAAMSYFSSSPNDAALLEKELNVIFRPSLYIKRDTANSRGMTFVRDCHKCEAVFHQKTEDTYASMESPCYYNKATNRIYVNGTTKTLEECGLTIVTHDVDQTLLWDLLNILLDVVVLPFVNKIIGVIDKTGTCENATTVLGENDHGNLLAIISYCFLALGWLSVSVGFAYGCWRDTYGAPCARRRRARTEMTNFFDNNDSLAFHPRVPSGMRVAVPIFLFSLAFGLLAAVFSPTCLQVVTYQIHDDTYGVINAVRVVYSQVGLWDVIAKLCADREFVLLKVICSFTGIFPFVKCALLFVVWYAPPHIVPLRWRSWLIHFLHVVGKYTLIDIFLVIISFQLASGQVTVRSNPYTHTSIDLQFSAALGFYLFAGCAYISLFISDAIMRYHRQNSYAIEQRTISSRSTPLEDIAEYYLMLQLAKAPSTALESHLPITRADLPHAFSLGDFHQQCALARQKRLIEEVQATLDARHNDLWSQQRGHRETSGALRGYMDLDRYWWTRLRVLHVRAGERYIIPVLLGIALLLLYHAFFFQTVAVSYGGLVGYLLNDGREVPADALYVTADRFFSMSNFGTDFVNTAVLDGSVDAHVVIVQVFYFLTALIIPTIIAIVYSILWCTPLPAWCWPRIRSCMRSLHTYSGFHILVFTTILELLSLERFPMSLFDDECSSVEPLLDALFGHLFQARCFTFTAKARGWTVLLGAWVVVAIMSVWLTTRRIEHLSDLVGATVKDTDPTHGEKLKRRGSSPSSSTQPLPSARFGLVAEPGPSDDTHATAGASVAGMV